MLNENAARFSVKEVSIGADAFIYKVYDKRTLVCDAPSLKAARRVREALVLDELAANAGIEQPAA